MTTNGRTSSDGWSASSLSGRWPIGGRYDGGIYDVTREAVREYAATIGDTSARSAQGDVAPPMFHVVPLQRLIVNSLREPVLGISPLRMLHGEHRMRFLRPLCPGERVRSEAELLAVDEKATGRRYRFAYRAWVGDHLVLDGETLFFVRSDTLSRAERVEPVPVEVPSPPDVCIEQAIAPDLARRYAAISGDHNPLHLDAEFASDAGYPGVILHGLCTMALAQRDLVAQIAEGDSTRLAALGVRFTYPVFLGDTLRLMAWRCGKDVRFMTFDSANRPVLRHGRAAFR